MDPRFSDATGSCQFRTSATGLGFLLFLHMHRQAPEKEKAVELTGAYVVSYCMQPLVHGKLRLL